MSEIFGAVDLAGLQIVTVVGWPSNPTTLVFLDEKKKGRIRADNEPFNTQNPASSLTQSAIIPKPTKNNDWRLLVLAARDRIALF